MSVILVDVDGVVADTHTSWLSMYNRDYGDNLKVADITRWAMHEFVKPECGRKIYEYLERPDFYDETLPIKEALEGVRFLRQLGHRVIFVSAGLFESKVRWLGRFGFLNEFPYKDDCRASTALDVVLCNDKSLIKGDYLIDDRVENVERYGDGFVFSQPWNVNADFYGGRVDSWMDISLMFSMVAKRQF